jgi:DNA-binding NarL/FixJ family response regulator
MQLLIVADNALTAEGIRRALRHAGACRVAGFTSSRHDCRLAVRTAAPDVVIVDHTRYPEPTLARIREAHGALPTAKVILLTEDLGPGWLEQATAAGASAAIARSVQPATFGTLVRELAAGTVFHLPAAAADPALDLAEIPALTERELQILRLVAAGAANASIAGKLWVTEQTVKFHLSNVYRKLGVANRTAASHYAHIHGLTAPPAMSPEPLQDAA